MSRLPITPKASKIAPMSAMPIISILLGFISCTIQPPLHLPQESVMVEVPIVITELEVIWETEAEWQAHWYYGWDAEDEERWGTLQYPEPTYFEVRRYFQGEEQSEAHKLEESFTIYSKRFKRRYNFGYYDMLIWSNIDSKDGTQTVVINEKDPDNIWATTTSTTTAYAKAPSRATPLKKQPDIFYDGYERDFYISRDIADYDYYDEDERAWVKLLKARLDPVVYIYLVQVIIHNNKGRITGLADDATLTGLADAVNLNTGRTSVQEVDVVFGMRKKNDIDLPSGETVDILGSKFTTFGLCGMEPWRVSRGAQYAGSRTDLDNNVLLDLRFNNASDAVFTYNVTPQMRKQAHGGVITIEIDADTITIPSSGTSAGSGFRPWVEGQDSVTHEFGM